MRGSYLFLQVLALLGSATAFWGMAPKMPSCSTTLRMMSEVEMDPNFEAHLPSMLKVGLQERPSYDFARELRQKYHDSVRTKRVAATALRTVNKELAVELEEIADEMEESHDRFVNLAMQWDAWGRPDPDLPSQLRTKAANAKVQVETMDPNFESHLPQFMAAGRAEDRSSPDLPKELRFKHMAAVKRKAAQELRNKNINHALAEELDELAGEMDEAYERFVQVSNKNSNGAK